ncbi:hypothetical protein QJS04_geneDACA014091 [Acorus gramineus]|uniref:Uncharacterized protein n=1 Tax=Acorus gramineus TaxID=55184 RepID=A0AAV9B6J6_ACOGR|nr:hypothetical protein QJS04_geneDACA014091 [Acorus gramineus]
MQSRESESFLLHSFDDFDESLSDYKLTAPACGESNDMLNVDGDKNDYDWLLTPPDTPLFPSLDDDGDDDDETPPVNFFQRGRPLSQPIAISRSTTMEKSLKSDRSSPSPHQLSPSSRSSSNTLHSRGRPSSTPHSSSPPALQPITPSRRSSPPPNKPSTPTMGPSTPTLRRINTGSRCPPSSSGRRGLSLGNASRRNSASPKLQAWQSSVSGFSAEVPPNLCTSLSDRPPAQVRDLSPVSNGGDSNLRHGRQSMSPTASRSANSSHSHERSHFESRDIGSMASSGNEDVDSLHSVAVGISGSTVVRKLSAFPRSRASSFSKKPSRIISSSAPKRSIDSAIHQMVCLTLSKLFLIGDI